MCLCFVPLLSIQTQHQTIGSTCSNVERVQWGTDGVQWGYNEGTKGVQKGYSGGGGGGGGGALDGGGVSSGGGVADLG